MNEKIDKLIGLIMKNFAGKIKICKTPECYKESWIDGYCKKCADYILQKQILHNLEENSKLMLSLTSNIKNVESRIFNIEQTLKSPPTNISQSDNIRNSTTPISSFKDEDIFIPSIDMNDDCKMLKTKSVTSEKNILKISKKLPNI